MPTFEDLKVVLEKTGKYIVETAKDFKYCWAIYPNVLFWCGVGFLIAAFV